MNNYSYEQIFKKNIYHDGSAWECENCGESWVFEFGGPTENNYNYCPNCGVKFDEYVSYVEEEDEESEVEHDAVL